MKIIFCVPGLNFSNSFLSSWTKLIKYLESKNIEWESHFLYSPIIHNSRVFISRYVSAMWPDYDYMMWIDSDMVFKPEHFEKLLYHKDKDIVSGVYLAKMKDEYGRRVYAMLNNNQKVTEEKLKNMKRDESGLIEMYSNGMGWMLVKKGVFEKLENCNKWKQPFISETLLDTKLHQDAFIEDTAFQQNAKENGFKCYIDPSIIIGHEKPEILQ
tara:strand:- start:1147 stop:1785 length:639 start_codon:yes stop_codon:yes gene_type:complete